MEGCAKHESLILTLTSNSSLDLYPTNSPTHFKNRIPWPIKNGYCYEAAIISLEYESESERSGASIENTQVLGEVENNENITSDAEFFGRDENNNIDNKLFVRRRVLANVSVIKEHSDFGLFILSFNTLMSSANYKMSFKHVLDENGIRFVQFHNDSKEGNLEGWNLKMSTDFAQAIGFSDRNILGVGSIKAPSSIDKVVWDNISLNSSIQFELEQCYNEFYDIEEPKSNDLDSIITALRTTFTTHKIRAFLVLEPTTKRLLIKIADFKKNILELRFPDTINAYFELNRKFTFNQKDTWILIDDDKFKKTTSPNNSEFLVQLENYKSQKSNYLYIACDLVFPQVLGSSALRYLMPILIAKNNQNLHQIKIENPIYLPIYKEDIFDIEISLMKNSKEYASVSKNHPTTLVIHIRGI